jgi:hypothetical protein
MSNDLRKLKKLEAAYVVQWSEFLAVDPEVSCSIPGATIYSE